MRGGGEMKLDKTRHRVETQKNAHSVNSRTTMKCSKHHITIFASSQFGLPISTNHKTLVSNSYAEATPESIYSSVHLQRKQMLPWCQCVTCLSYALLECSRAVHSRPEHVGSSKRALSFPCFRWAIHNTSNRAVDEDAVTICCFKTARFDSSKTVTAMRPVVLHERCL